MFKVRAVFVFAKLLLVLGIVGNIVGVLHLGLWAEQERDASARFIGPPLSVRLVGVLYPPDQKGEHWSKTLKVSADERSWNFDVEKLDVLTASISEMRILQALRPYSLRLSGPAEVLGVLQGTELVGKPLTIMGYLYIDHHRLMVSSIDMVPEEGR